MKTRLKMNETLSFMGDVHGNYHRIYAWQSVVDNSHMVQVGDFGAGYRGNHRKISDLNHRLAKSNNRLYVVRGNHDDPACFNAEDRPRFSNIEFLPDNSIITLCGMKLLCIGGAVSIDRIDPKYGNVAWDGEEFKYADGMDDVLKQNPDIDIVVTHIQANFITGITKGELVMSFAANDQELLNDLALEQLEIAKLHEGIRKAEWPDKERHWFYGHYHRPMNFYHNNWKRIGLGIDEIYEIVDYTK